MLPLLTKLLAADDLDLQREAVHALAEHPAAKSRDLLLATARDAKRDERLRAHAIVALSDRAEQLKDDLLPLTRSDSRVLRDEALRALVGVRPDAAASRHLKALAGKDRATADLVARVLEQPLTKGRPPAKDLDAWVKRLEAPADAAAGRRIFFHPRLAACFRCHRVEGRGQDVGPDLSTIGHRDRRFILESILQPSNEIAPHYQTWSIITADGRTRTGMLVNTYLDEYTYIDEKGNRFEVLATDVADVRAAKNSIMPEGLLDVLTDQEIRDLVAYLVSRK
jgi:putative heme-binding domain-containing protein